MNATDLTVRSLETLAALMSQLHDHEMEDSFNVAEAKKQFSELLGRVAFGGESFLITRRGRPMAKLVPVRDEPVGSSLAEVQGWLADDDPFFEIIDDISSQRATHVPRVLQQESDR